VQLVEQTSKPPKLGLLVSTLVACVGLIAMYASCAGAFTSASSARDTGYGVGVSIAVTLIATCAMIVFKVLIWWHHG
jgi:hypothetical protein